VWIELRPITGRAIWLVGFLSKPKMKAPGSASPRSRYRFSLRRLISLFLRQSRSRPDRGEQLQIISALPSEADNAEACPLRANSK
jgi:hypothetical protein